MPRRGKTVRPTASQNDEPTTSDSNTAVVGPSTAVAGPSTVVAGPSTAVDSRSTDGMEEHLTCSICCEVIHNCVGLQPCMHCFCGGCYSQWMGKSTDCPQCRVKVERVGPNHMMSNLIEAFLVANPSKRRSDEEIKELDAGNKFNQISTTGTVPVFKELEPPTNSDSDSDLNESYEDFDSDEDDDDYYEMPTPPKKRRTGGFAGCGAVMCRQCPGAVSPKDAASRRQREVLGETAKYFCPASIQHVQCACCGEYMPDREADRLQNNNIPAQKCEICVNGSYFCHMYFGRCKNYNHCVGCLAPLKNAHVPDYYNIRIVSNNEVESDTLMNHLASRNTRWRDELVACMAKLDSGEFSIRTDEFRPAGRDITVTSSTVACAQCALQCSAQLAYQCRRDIDPQDLPARMASREDCYWGRNCRTQGKLHHAMKFNHICEQTRMQ